MPNDLIHKQCTGFLNTPPLWDGNEFGITQFNFPETDLIDFIPDEIPKNIRLGHQMEHVFKQLVEHSKRYEILVHNLPIRDNNRTLGEVDYILKDLKTEQLIHVELTYKFYVVDLEIEEPIHQLIGPNRGDAFYTKVQKIKNNQFQLLHSEEGVKALKLNNIDHSEIIHQVCYKTQLFTPINTDNQLITQLNHDCVYGYWLPFKDFGSKDFLNHQFYMPTKSEWAIEPHKTVAWKNHFETQMQLQLRMQKRKSPIVWMQKSEKVFEKFFVVWW